ncbi:MAG: hypothetical protein ACLFPS_05505 [Clostridia bacterium]
MDDDNLAFTLKLFDKYEVEVLSSKTNNVADIDDDTFIFSKNGLTYQYNLNTRELSLRGVYMLKIYLKDKIGGKGLVGFIYLEIW